jgi:uncharacterized protein (TIGR02996 family)
VRIAVEKMPEGLLREIRENPDDNDVRLIAADWLDEHDQPKWAELIRVQAELARMVDSDEERTDEYDNRFTLLYSRERTLLRELLDYFASLLKRAGALDPAADYLTSVTRGFPDCIDLCVTSAWIQHGDDTLARLPITCVYLLTPPTIEDREDGVWIVGDNRLAATRPVRQEETESFEEAICRTRWQGVRFHVLPQEDQYYHQRLFNTGSQTALEEALNHGVAVCDGGEGPTTLNVLPTGSARHTVVRGSSELHLCGGIVRNVDAYDTSKVTIFPPAQTGTPAAWNVTAHDTSVVVISPDGEGSSRQLMLSNIVARDKSRVVSNGAEAGAVRTYNSSHLIVNWLSIHHGLDANDQSVVDLNGPGFYGQIGQIETRGHSRVNLRATFPGQRHLFITTADNSTVAIFGKFDHPPGSITDESGWLNGTLQHGGEIAINFHRNDESRIIIEPGG